MEYTDKEYCLEVSGEYACFTRPEFKVERVSYDIITPSATRGIFESILWKPAIKWQPTRVDVLNPMDNWLSIRRNEVGSLASTRVSEIIAEERRQQRASRILRDVRYRLYAKMIYIPIQKRAVEQEGHRSDENPAKYQAMFERRAAKGQCFNHPYLGCREFSCSSIHLVKKDSKQDDPIEVTRDLGYILYDLDFSDPKNPVPAFFRAQIDRGVMQIPDWESEEVIM